MAGTVFARYLDSQHQKDLLRLITCGSVDDGKSTLLGRLLHDTGSVPEDIVDAARRDSLRFGTDGTNLDYALLIDGLQSEREQGITIDVAYRYFDTPRRKFVLADTPGHEQYTRNMATGASGADLAILLVDASRGLQPQTRRHAFIARLLGIRQLVVAVNKMDLVEWRQDAYERLVADCRAAFASLEVPSLEFVPVSARDGDFVVGRGRADWYRGRTLLEHLEAADSAPEAGAELRLPVQYVSRPDASFRGYSGTLASGRLAIGDAVVALPSGARSTVREILTPDGPRTVATAGESVTVTFADQVDVGRGQVMAHVDAPPSVARGVEADVVWMTDAPLAAGQGYEFKFAHRYVAGTVEALVHRVDVHDYSRRASESLGVNDIGRVRVLLEEAVALDAYDEQRTTGSFVIIDRATLATVGAGLVRSTSTGRLIATPTAIGRAQRAAQKRQQPFVLWFTGLSGAGKSTIAAALEQALFRRGLHTYLLDGDRVRQGLNRDLGFGELDRRENLRRVGELARTLTDAGLISIVACISPLIADRERARDLIGADDFLEVHVHASLEACEGRDPKGHYRRARAGTLKQFTGIDAPYEAPATPDVRVDTTEVDVEGAVARILAHLERTGRLAASGDTWEI
jgi:bifunctional enzyme CysN/CysC